jgi:hypothetical protein
MIRRDVFARRKIGRVRRRLVHRGAERDCREIGLFMIMPGARDELDDYGTHEGSSHTAIAIRPISASDIRYAVIGFS